MRALSILFMLLLASPAMAAPMVTIAQGALGGAGDNGVDSYKDIPYTAPPIGPLRWQAPGAAPHWSGTRDAGAFGPACPQHATEGLVVRANLPQSEDCLTLNIWSPQQRSAKLPVMVWIHGGGFTQGAASVPRFDGAGLARRGVLMVSLNYRLGRLGFFAYPGLSQVNFGLLDQIAALRWVRHNIAAFGGDPDNVTVFGESAGAVAVDALMVSPLAKGLFAKAISESGGTFGTTSMADAQKSAQKFAASIHVSGPDALKTLRAVTLDQLLANGEETGPIVDGTVLPMAIDTAFAQGRVAPVPYLAGTNSNEGVLLGDGDASWLDKSLGERRDAVRALYDKDGKLNDDEFHRALFNDEFFAGPTADFAAAITRAGAPSYVYRFDFLTDVGRRRGETSVPHGGEMVFIFGFGSLAAFAPQQDTAMSATMQSYWTNFAKTGDPNGAGVPPWPKFKGPTPSTLVIDAAPHVVSDFRRAQFDAVNPARTPAP